jgi:hypothetical protein
MKTLVAFIIASSLAWSAWGQLDVPDTLLTVGTTTTDASGRPWVYAVWTPSQPELLAGKRLGVAMKAGAEGGPGLFAPTLPVSPGTEVAVLQVFLQRASQLGENLSSLSDAVTQLYQRSNGAGDPSLAEKLSALLQQATVDAPLDQNLRFLAQGHPSLRMALGLGWAGPTPVALGEVFTLELRELDAAGEVVRVLGRLTLTAGQPDPLPAPGAPVQVPDLTPKGDLNIKLRWSTPDPLRRQSLLSAGVVLWRVPLELAVTRGWDNTPPTLNDLQGAAQLITPQSIIPEQMLTAAEAIDFVTLKDLVFYSDDGNRYRMNAEGVNVDDPLVEGSEWFYFATARDLLGRDGAVSPGGRGIVCRTLPPKSPFRLKLENHWQPAPNSSEGTQGFLFSFESNTDTDRDTTQRYEIYRGSDNLPVLQDPALREGLVPLATVAHAGDAVWLSYVDDAADVKDTRGKTFWFSVRAIHDSPCGPIKSPFSAPVFGSLRERTGPDATSGVVDRSCPNAAVICQPQRFEPYAGPQDGRRHFRVECTRQNRGIASATFWMEVISRGVVVSTINFPTHVFAETYDTVVQEIDLPIAQLGDTQLFYCVTQTYGGTRGNTASCAPQLTPPGDVSLTLSFLTAALTDAELVPGEPLSDVLLGPPVGVQILSLDPEDFTAQGVASVQLDGQTLLIQATSIGGIAAIWRTVGFSQCRQGVIGWRFPGNPGNVSVRAFPVLRFDDSPCEHLTTAPGSQEIPPLQIRFPLKPRTEEWRLFRRVDDGPYTLIRHGLKSFNPSVPSSEVVALDTGLPMTRATVCYYAQLVDRDGNGSALVRLEPCVPIQPVSLPAPRLSPPESAGTREDPIMRLTWSCPPVGVDRFRVFVKPLNNKPLPPKFGADFTRVTAGGIPIIYSPVGSAFKPVQTLAAGSIAKVASSPEFFETGRLGGNFPSAPPFTVDFHCEEGVTYEVRVSALGVPKLEGPSSATHSFTWTFEEPAPEPVVPWPARPLPPSGSFPGVEAVRLATPIPPGGPSPDTTDQTLWPYDTPDAVVVGVRVATLASTDRRDYRRPRGAQGDPHVVYNPRQGSAGAEQANPNLHVYAPMGNGKPELAEGFVLYRRQVPSPLFPQAQGDTVQVSPLVRQIAFKPAIDGPGIALSDPFFAVRFRFSPKSEIEDTFELCLLDTQPVVMGARYEYTLVTFSPRGELLHSVNAGQLLIE